MMKTIIYIFLLLLFPYFASSQIENVFVETYYVTSEDDGFFPEFGKLEKGAVTYRIFIDLKKGSKLTKIYGDQNHPLIFSSTKPIFNHLESGVSLGYNINKNRLKENTTLLDSWLTLGQFTRATNEVQFGIPKKYDLNGASGLGIDENEDRILKNSDPIAGIPLSMADGYSISFNKPSSWYSQGFTDPVTNDENTIFGKTDFLTKLESYDVILRNAGVEGISQDSNQVLIGQITTAGDLSFELNLEVITEGNKTIKYVGNNKVILEDETFLSILKYPLVCGCKDQSYLEYNSAFSCTDNSKCRNPIVFGCLDAKACNYNSTANFHLESLCCYIGYCNDNDISIICPDLDPRDEGKNQRIKIRPNPASESIEIIHNYTDKSNVKIIIRDLLGKVVAIENNFTKLEFDVNNLIPGLYTLSLFNQNQVSSTTFIKQ